MSNEKTKKGLVARALNAVDGLVGAGTVDEVLAPPADPQDEATQSDASVERAEGFAERAEAHHNHVASADALADYERAQTELVPSFEQMPQDGRYQLRFANGETFLDGARDLDRTDLSADAGRAAYSKKVEFEAAGERAIVTEAWLIAASGEACRCLMGVGLPVGGGHRAEIPAGFLSF